MDTDTTKIMRSVMCFLLLCGLADGAAAIRRILADGQSTSN
jgi:hypothetical protein